jgi:hypothetical protein
MYLSTSIIPCFAETYSILSFINVFMVDTMRGRLFLHVGEFMTKNMMTIIMIIVIAFEHVFFELFTGRS